MIAQVPSTSALHPYRDRQPMSRARDKRGQGLEAAAGALKIHSEGESAGDAGHRPGGFKQEDVIGQVQPDCLSPGGLTRKVPARHDPKKEPPALQSSPTRLREYSKAYPGRS